MDKIQGVAWSKCDGGGLSTNKDDVKARKVTEDDQVAANASGDDGERGIRAACE